MDVISHWFWGILLTRKKVSWKIAGPMGVLPDLLAFIPVTIISMAQGIERVNVDDSTVTADFHPLGWQLYQWTHSFIFPFMIFLVALFVLRKREDFKRTAFIFVIPWIAHIIADIPSHTLQFFPTPFLHPFSDWMFDGIRWSNPWVWFTNVGLLVLLWFIQHKREKDVQSIDLSADTAALA